MRVLSEILVLLVKLYQWTLRPFIGAQCRFEPSCSHYAIEALRLHGPVRGSALAAGRVLRCNPWNEGGHDPAPPGRHCRCHPTLPSSRGPARAGRALEAMNP